MSELLLFTDLDGTLLDHHDYSFAAADEAISALNEADIPWILNSSKTVSEMLQLRGELDQHHPLIVENGAGIAVPEDYDHPAWQGLTRKPTAQRDGFLLYSLGRSRAEILGLLAPLKQQFEFTGFADMDVETLIEHTGLPADRAEKALNRHFSEPIIWQQSDPMLSIFARTMHGMGLKLLRGGRFIHVMGDVDKGRAMQLLASAYRGATTVALGDSDNDLAMLRAADIAVVVRSPVHAPPLLEHDNATVTELLGPAGWNRAVLSILQQQRSSQAEAQGREGSHR